MMEGVNPNPSELYSLLVYCVWNIFGCIYLDSNVGPGEKVDRGPLHTFFFPLPHRCLFGGWGRRVENYRGFSLEEILEQQRKKKVCAPL